MAANVPPPYDPHSPPYPGGYSKQQQAPEQYPGGYPTGQYPGGYPQQQAPVQYPGGYPQQQALGQYPPPGPYQTPPGWTPPQPAPVASIAISAPPTVVHVAGGCPVCHSNAFVDHFGCGAIFLGILFFPIGILCCLAMRQKRCANCGFVVS